MSYGGLKILIRRIGVQWSDLNPDQLWVYYACLHLSNQKRYKMYTKLEKFIRYRVIPEIL